MALLKAAGAVVLDEASFQKELDATWKQLGVSEESDRARLLADEVRGVGVDVDALRVAAGGQRAVVVAALIAVALAALVSALFASGRVFDALAGSGTIAVIGALSYVAGVVIRARQGLARPSRVATDPAEA
jgi:hypothetical protein